MLLHEDDRPSLAPAPTLRKGDCVLEPMESPRSWRRLADSGGPRRFRTRRGGTISSIRTLSGFLVPLYQVQMGLPCRAVGMDKRVLRGQLAAGYLLKHWQVSIRRRLRSRRSPVGCRLSYPPAVLASHSRPRVPRVLARPRESMAPCTKSHSTLRSQVPRY